MEKMCYVGLKGLCPLRIPARDAVPLNPALRSEGQGLSNIEIKAGLWPRDERARENVGKI